jgi:N-acetylneuraminic acid mutarotase
MQFMKNRSALSAAMVLIFLLLLTACGKGHENTTAPVHNEWCWVSGSPLVNQPGVYGVKSVPTDTTVPGGRLSAASWKDKDGNFWLFGGVGSDATGTVAALNDLWKFDGRKWTWMSGDSIADQPGNYGVKSMHSGTNVPGSRKPAASWTDRSGNFWLFGGLGYDSLGAFGELNDLWKFDGSSWTWISGENITDQSGIYGVKSVATGTSCPGSREGSSSWTGKEGSLWLFGGYGFDSLGQLGFLNDLWEFDGSNWTWISGGNSVNQEGSYGNQGEAQPLNAPGSRFDAVSWIDSSGNLWLFGGAFLYSAGTGTDKFFNDLWKFDGSSWTWIYGQNTPNQAGVYGTQGLAVKTNVPGARISAVSWVDQNDNLWLFGGYGYDSGGNSGELNDLWRFDGANWTWMRGSDTVNQLGSYGVQTNIVSELFMPGAREGAAAWTDNSGNLWLFGGYGYGADLFAGHLNDLWVYLP